MKKIILTTGLLFALYTTETFAQLEVIDNNTLKLGGQAANLFLGRTGKYGEAAGKTFDPTNTANNGLVIENGTTESSGIYMDGDFIVMWSPGDGGANEKGTQGYLVKVYDEDGWQLRWFIDGNGTAFTNSDSTRKEDIEQITSSISKIKQMHSVKYYYKRTDKEKSKLASALDSTSKNSSNTINITEDTKSPGFLAQEMEKILPEVVRTDDQGKKFINYSGIIPYTVQAIQEQQAIIEKQDATIKSQADDIAAIKTELAELKKLVKKQKN
jgi:hypothetical protein